MTGNNTFARKIVYFLLIVVLLVPLYLISHPSTLGDDGVMDEGGTLARMRIANDLSQANLGEIDPAGASMSLATLGMRGVAANLLWGQAIKYKKTENWDALKATLNQITKLQPNFESVWVFQAWNLAYNVSVEFDDFRHRYHWVKKGINYLIDGTRYNRSMPSLLHEVGWFFQHKLGRADERRQYRKLFRDDEDFHAQLDAPDLPIHMDLTNGPDKKPDNWLVAYEWYRAGEELVETRDAPIRRKNPLLFYSNAAMTLMYYATAIQDDGHLGETSQAVWRRAEREWNDFGDHGIPTRLGVDIRLNDLERLRQKVISLRIDLNSLVPNAEEKLRAERIAALPKRLQDALEIPPSERTAEQRGFGLKAKRLTNVSLVDIALKASADNIAAARRYAKQAFDAESAVTTIERERHVVNFIYWRTRSQSEQTEETLSARRHLFEADRLFKDTDLENARLEYELAFVDWAKVYKKFPILLDDVDAEENYEAVNRYKRLLDRIDQTFPPPGFPLMDLLEFYDGTYLDTAPAADAGSATPAGGEGAEIGIQAGDPEKEAAVESADPDESNSAAAAESGETVESAADEPAAALPLGEAPAEPSSDRER